MRKFVKDIIYGHSSRAIKKGKCKRQNGSRFKPLHRKVLALFYTTTTLFVFTLQIKVVSCQIGYLEMLITS